MTHDELLEEINTVEHPWWMQDALRAVVELHKPEHSQSGYRCTVCFTATAYPCPTIQAIESALNG